MLPVARRILQKQPLILTALDYETAAECIERLPPQGLSLTIGFNDPEIPTEYQRWIERHLGKS